MQLLSEEIFYAKVCHRVSSVRPLPFSLGEALLNTLFPRRQKTICWHGNSRWKIQSVVLSTLFWTLPSLWCINSGRDGVSWPATILDKNPFLRTMFISLPEFFIQVAQIHMNTCWKTFIMAHSSAAKHKSSLSKDINDLVRGGGNVTHFLKVKVSNPRSSEEGKRIRRRIFQCIGNIPRYQSVKGSYFSITWRTSAIITAKIYHCDVRLFNDLAVKEHSRALLCEILSSLDAEFDHIFSRNITVISFFVTKPLSTDVCLSFEE